MFPVHIFKSYDIRGLVGEEINDSFVDVFGKAMVKRFQPKRIVLGRDMRPSSLPFAQQLIELWTQQGIDVVDIGLVTTPAFAFAINEHLNAYDVGVMITASHNPAQYNGMKVITGDGRSVGSGSGMEELRDAATRFADGAETLPDANKLGTCTQDGGLIERYIDAVIARASVTAPASPVKIAIDAGNGMTGVTLPILAKKLPWLEIIPMYYELDGTFPHHEANPLKNETLHDLSAMVKREGCIAGFAYDGDGDRIGCVDEHGEQISGDMLTALLSASLLDVEANMGRHILYDLRSSNIVPAVIAQHGGSAAMCRVGHAHIKKQMRDENALFAGELSMHFYYQEFGYAEASEYTMLLLLKQYLSEGKAFSEMVAPLRVYGHSGERNYHVEAPKQVLERASEMLVAQGGEISTLDGVRAVFSENGEWTWWVSLRASNTEPVLRMNLETRDPSLCDEKVVWMEKLLGLPEKE